MDRLTIEYCGEYVPKEMCSIDRLGGADDCDLCCEYCKATEDGNEDCKGCAINKCFNKLGEYETLEEQGKLLKLPVAVGNTVWCVHMYSGGGRVPNWGKVYQSKFTVRMHDDFGKTVFLTKEKAEAALKEMSE